MANELEIAFPEMRYDITMPFFERRVKIDGVALKPAKTTSMVFEDNPKLREGDFGLCDLNLGYFLPAIDAGVGADRSSCLLEKKAGLSIYFLPRRSGNRFSQRSGRQNHRHAPVPHGDQRSR
jgi:hypothetical protein